ncbi:MAG: hypothetical protein HGA65_14325 [Oscillochloris sp.]|nr:hypothetical protein [Oscillochloris sp.]
MALWRTTPLLPIAGVVVLTLVSLVMLVGPLWRRDRRRFGAVAIRGSILFLFLLRMRWW